MPHREDLAKVLHAAHDAANEALSEVKAIIANIVEDEPEVARGLVLYLKDDPDTRELAEAIVLFQRAQREHKAASDAYLAALSERAGGK